MKLMTKELEQRFKAVGRQDVPDPIVVAKFFHPASSWTWYATAYEPKDRIFFGWVDGQEQELGYFSLDEMQETVVHGIGIERDLYWREKRLSQVRAEVPRH